METSAFDYFLDKNLIAQKPSRPRDLSRLLVIERKKEKIFHSRFFKLDEFLEKKDVLVFNDSKVIPARLFARKNTGSRVEVLLLKKKEKNWEVILNKKINEGTVLTLKKKPLFFLKVLKKNPEGTFLISFNLKGKKLDQEINRLGIAPTPPYIKRISNLKEYQTIYAQKPGSVAAPTAGFHFTFRLLKKLKKKGIRLAFITLHINLGTFGLIKEKEIEKHKMYSEWSQINKKTANFLNEAKKSGGRIIAVGTSSCRTLEAFSDDLGNLSFGEKEIDLFIYPGYQFKFVDGLITNFHLPRSTNLVLVSAFAGKKLIFKAYQEAIKEKYRFFSFGDAMLIV